MKLFVDMDGVLADFDTRATEILGMDSYKFEFMFGTAEFWSRLDAVPDLFFGFDPKPDMRQLWDAVAHLSPIILTALPRTGADEVAAQKRAWITKYLGDHVPVITVDGGKHTYVEPGALLIDDRKGAYKEKWELGGGVFIHHLDAPQTIAELRRLGVLAVSTMLVA